jgi:hypothetical protein
LCKLDAMPFAFKTNFSAAAAIGVEEGEGGCHALCGGGGLPEASEEEEEDLLALEEEAEHAAWFLSLI